MYYTGTKPSEAGTHAAALHYAHNTCVLVKMNCVVWLKREAVPWLKWWDWINVMGCRYSVTATGLEIR